MSDASFTVMAILIPIAFLAVSIVGFLLFRQVVLWYARINERTKIEKVILMILLRMADKNEILTEKERKAISYYLQDKEIEQFDKMSK